MEQVKISVTYILNMIIKWIYLFTHIIYYDRFRRQKKLFVKYTYAHIGAYIYIRNEFKRERVYVIRMFTVALPPIS